VDHGDSNLHYRIIYYNGNEIKLNKRPKGPVTLNWFSQIHWALWGGFFSTKFYTYMALAIMEQFKIPYLYKHELYYLKGRYIFFYIHVFDNLLG